MTMHLRSARPPQDRSNARRMNPAQSLTVREVPMDPVGKALWYVESHFAGEITLEEIAAAVGVSRFYLTRAFGEATGRSIMRYVRARRLAQAARQLAAGASDILGVALDSGY